MSASAALLSREDVAQIRHQLRTALNHIAGYAEMLVEDATEMNASAHTELENILESSRKIQDAVNLLLPPGTPVSHPSVEDLQRALNEPAARIIRSVGLLAQVMPSDHLMDLLRINVAAVELLSFAEGITPIERQAARTLRSAVKRTSSTTGRLLVVDDNEANRDMLCRQLERQGHKVELAENGSDALPQIANASFDLILLDVLMPEMDGLSVLQSIKGNPSTQNIPVVMISALDEIDHVAECLQAGADDYLMKPFKPVLLQARIAASLERKRLRDREQERSRELERANEELQQFAYVASHDLQEPLRTLAVYAQLLTRRWQDRIDPESKQFLTFIVDAAQRGRTLVEDVLALSRAGLNEKPAQSVDLNTILRQVVSNLHVTITETGAAITSDELPVVISDAAEMTQLLQNLVGNAIKYRRPNVTPKIHISSVRQDGSWTVNVADNGLGISREFAEEVFLPFKRLHSLDIPGTGIGLALCRRIIERHGGRIWVEPGASSGSTFCFTLPVDPRVQRD